MLDYSNLKKGVQIIIEGEPYEIIEARPLKMAQRRVVLQTKLRNLISGNLISRNFQQGETFEEAEISKFEAKFLYSHRGRFFFCQKDNPSKRFDLTLETIGESSKFLKPGQIVEGLLFEEKVINVSLPIKVQLKVIEAPPGVKGERAQPGTKLVTLETGAQISAPLFIEQGDIIEVNTETGEYVRRVE
jgi:elongation factor P